MNETLIEQPLIVTIAQIAGLWIVSDFGYYAVLPLFGFNGGYNEHPLIMALYYAAWSGFAFILYRDYYRGLTTKLHRPSLYVSVFIAIAFIIAYLSIVFPALPTIPWSAAATPPPDLLSASQWYFLPKSFEILLQQLLLIAFIRAFMIKNFSLRSTMVWCALLFGSIHLLLIFGEPFIKAAIFTVAAFIAGSFFPYLMIRVKNGLVYSYCLHWAFYAVIIVIVRVVMR
jgi:hypothetical protein